MTYDTITIDGVIYSLVPFKQEKQFICQLDGYNYYLGEEADIPMTWDDAIHWVEDNGMELPNRAVATILFDHFSNYFRPGWYWTNQESKTDPTDYAWVQGFISGTQGYSTKTTVRYFHGVYKEKA